MQSIENTVYESILNIGKIPMYKNEWQIWYLL